MENEVIRFPLTEVQFAKFNDSKTDIVATALRKEAMEEERTQKLTLAGDLILKTFLPPNLLRGGEKT